MLWLSRVQLQRCFLFTSGRATAGALRAMLEALQIGSMKLKAGLRAGINQIKRLA